jgi:hypothetical protein
VRTDGADTNDGLANVADTTGTAGQAWLTLGKALTVAQPGDTVTVLAGSYPEYAQSVRSGTNGNPITFNTTGGDVFCYGWKFTHAYISVDGFTARHHSRVNNTDSAFCFSTDSANIIVTNCHIGPGMWLHATDFVFSDTNPDTISTAGGGFIAAGFRAGATVKINHSTADNQTLNNSATVTVDSVTDTTLTLTGGSSVTAESGVTAILYGGARGFHFATSSNTVLVDGCTIADAACVWMTMGGSNHIVQNCVFADGLGFDGALYGGTNNVFRRNLLHDSMDIKYWSPTPDGLAQNDYGGGTINGVTITENIIMDWKGGAGVDHGSPGANLVLSNNVIYNCGGGWTKFSTENTSFLNNTIVNTGISTIPTFIAAQDHQIAWWDTANNPTVGVVKNNLLIGNGYEQTATVGWYFNAEPSLSLTADYNYVAGPSPTFALKTGFSETNGINGGNPMFVDINDPLGPDGIVFTDDDGLRLAPGSPAIGEGEAGADIGAYDYSEAPPSSGTLNATTTNAGTITVQ